MENQKCQQCSAPMVLINKRDGTNAYVCEYCGYVLDIRPKTASDKVFSFVNRAINALKDDSPIVSSPKYEMNPGDYTEEDDDCSYVIIEVDENGIEIDRY